jgi:alkaline phosphatase
MVGQTNCHAGLALIAVAAWGCAGLQAQEATTQPMTETEKAKNIILIIGDGMGLAQVAASAYALNGQGDDAAGLVWEYWPAIGYQMTHSTDSLVPDSAATATAMAAGVKTYNGAIGLGPDRERVETILEQAHARGMATGLVTSVPLDHATPASFHAHEVSRNNYNEIVDDYLTEPIVDVILGGSIRADSPSREIMEARATSGGYQWMDIDDVDALNDVEPGDRLFGNFESNDNGRLDYLLERASEDSPEPHLTDLTRAAVTALSANSNGFFLMLEGGAIDWASHGNELDNAVDETIELHRTVSALLEQLDELGALDETLLVLTADHECGGLTLPGPYGSTLNAGENPEAHWSTTNHTVVPVLVWARGPGSASFARRMDNTDIYHGMRAALRD